MDMLQYFGGQGDNLVAASVRPGKPVNLRTESPVETLTVLTPRAEALTVLRGKMDTFHFSETDQVGLYQVRQGTEISQRFAVNLFDGTESTLQVREKFKAGHVEVQGVAAPQPKRRQAWKWLVLAALGVLVFEWYIYNRRIYL